MPNSVRKMTATAICVSLMCISAFISFPLGHISLSLQLFAVYFALYFLGPLYGSVSVVVYLLLGVVGLPVYSSFGGGISAFVGPSGGFLFGFLALALVYSLALFFLRSIKGGQIIATVLSLIALYICGSMYYSVVYLGGLHSYGASLIATVLPFVLPDIAKIALAFLISGRIKTLKN